MFLFVIPFVAELQERVDEKVSLNSFSSDLLIPGAGKRILNGQFVLELALSTGKSSSNFVL